MKHIARKRFGQHFLSDKGIVEAIVDAIDPKAGQAMVEPPDIRMTGHNRSATEPTRVVIVFVADPGTPFLHAVH